MSKYKTFSIMRDTREKPKCGWLFESEEKKPSKHQLMETVIDTIDAGDYCIREHPNILRIERKNGFGELFGNLSCKDNRERFYREMERLRNIPMKYIIVETNLSEDILGLAIPQIRFGMSCKRILDYLFDIEIEYGVHTIFAGDCGQKIARMLFEKALTLHT